MRFRFDYHSPNKHTFLLITISLLLSSCKTEQALSSFRHNHTFWSNRAFSVQNAKHAYFNNREHLFKFSKDSFTVSAIHKGRVYSKKYPIDKVVSKGRYKSTYYAKGVHAVFELHKKKKTIKYYKCTPKGFKYNGPPLTEFVNIFNVEIRPEVQLKKESAISKKEPNENKNMPETVLRK